MNNIFIENNKLFVDFFVKDQNNTVNKVRFLVDTGFTGTIVFIFGKNYSDFSNAFEFFNVGFLNEKDWIKVASGVKIKTMQAGLYFEVNNKFEFMDVSIIEGEKDDYPVIGIEFLKQNKNILNLDFKNNKFNIK